MRGGGRRNEGGGYERDDTSLILGCVCAGRAPRSYYAVDPGCADCNGRPQYKKVQADGSFCKPGEATYGSQHLYWWGDWLFGGFGGPSTNVLPYVNRADTPQPPHGGWMQNGSGTAPDPVVTFL